MSTQADIGRQTKVILAIGIVILAGGSYLAYTWYQSHNTNRSVLNGVSTDGKGVATQESEAYRQVLDKYNQKNAQQAESNGQSYMSVMSTRSEQTPAASAAAAAAAQQPAQINYYYQQPQQAQQPQAARNKEYDKLVAEQVTALMAGWVAKPHSAGTVSDDVAYSQSIMAVSMHESNGVAAAQPGQTGAGQSNVPDSVVIPGFTLAPAILKTEIDTDENSIVRAEIMTGPFAGATCFAMGYKRLNETVDMSFSYMEWKGKSYKINAKAVDPDSMRTALSGDVNNRYFERIVLPALAMAIGKTGQLYERGSAQNIITSEGAVISTYPETPNGAAVAGTFAGGIGEQAGRVLANDGANMPQKQVVRPMGSTIGIQFIGPVMASDSLDKNAIQANQKAELDVLGQPAGQPEQVYRMAPGGSNGNGGYRNGVSNGYPGYTPGLGQPNSLNSTRY